MVPVPSQSHVDAFIINGEDSHISFHIHRLIRQNNQCHSLQLTTLCFSFSGWCHRTMMNNIIQMLRETIFVFLDYVIPKHKTLIFSKCFTSFYVVYLLWVFRFLLVEEKWVWKWFIHNIYYAPKCFCFFASKLALTSGISWCSRLEDRAEFQ